MDDAQRRGMRTGRIERCLDSGMTIGEWCELNKVGEFNLCKWMARLREEELALTHFHGHADERLLPMLGDHDELVAQLHRANYAAASLRSFIGTQTLICVGFPLP